jgi:hypothetical protein
MAKTINLDTSQRVDVICRKGDTFDLSLTIKDTAATPVSIVNKNDSFKMEVRVSDDSNTAYGTDDGDSDNNIILSTLDATSGATKKIDVKDSNGEALPYTDPASSDVIADGIVRFSVPSTIMASTSAGLYVYDIEMTDASDNNKVTTLIYGTFKINEDVSV